MVCVVKFGAKILPVCSPLNIKVELRARKYKLVCNLINDKTVREIPARL